MNSQAGAEVRYRKPRNLGNLPAKLMLEFGRIIQADCVGNANIERPIRCDSAGDMTNEARNTIPIAEYEARRCDAAVRCRTNDWYESEHFGNRFHPGGKAATTYRVA
jgi:hypothetical protein